MFYHVVALRCNKENQTVCEYVAVAALVLRFHEHGSTECVLLRLRLFTWSPRVGFVFSSRPICVGKHASTHTHSSRNKYLQQFEVACYLKAARPSQFCTFPVFVRVVGLLSLHSSLTFCKERSTDDMYWFAMALVSKSVSTQSEELRDRPRKDTSLTSSADIFAYGCVLFIMFGKKGYPLLHSDNIQAYQQTCSITVEEIIPQQINAFVDKRLSHGFANASEALQSVVASCLEAEPEKRGTAGTLRAAVLKLLESGESK